MKPTFIVLALMLSALAATAAPGSDTVFRCGPDRSIYSQTPCKDGTAVDVADPRTDAQRAQAAQAVKAEAAMTQKMARERREQEAAAAKEGAGKIPYSAANQAAAPASAASAAKHKHHRPKPKPKPQPKPPGQP